MQDPQRILTQEILAKLDVSPDVLASWIEEFSDFLSNDNESDGDVRFFVAQDLLTLKTIKAQLNKGNDFGQVRSLLEAQPVEVAQASEGELVVAPEETSIAAMSYFTEVIEDLHQGQLSVLNSQAANRELMGVLIQDNFNLKEENNRLRERMLNVERLIGQQNRDEMSRRESLRQEIEAKLAEIRMLASRNPVTVLQNRTGCLGSLFGVNNEVKTVQTPNIPPSNQAPGDPPRAYPPRPPGPPE